MEGKREARVSREGARVGGWVVVVWQFAWGWLGVPAAACISSCRAGSWWAAVPGPNSWLEPPFCPVKVGVLPVGACEWAEPRPAHFTGVSKLGCRQGPQGDGEMAQG